MTPLQEDDLFFVQRGTDKYNTTTESIKDFTLFGGFSGDVVIDGRTFTYENGLLVSVV